MSNSIEERKLLLQEKQLELEKLKLDFEIEKHSSKSKKKWKLNTINATIIVALIGFFATATVTIVNNGNVNQLETRKFEFDLIKKGLEQPTPDDRVKFLKFISRLKLVRDYSMTNAIDSAIEQPNTLPNLSPSKTPIGLTASRGNSPEGPVTVLTIVGGELGTNASWLFTTDSCNGRPAASGHARTIIVNPKIRTTYFVKAVGATGLSDCMSITVDPIKN